MISFCQSLKVEGFIVRRVGLPAGVNDAYPLECQRADSAVMRLASLALTPIKLIRPRRTSDTLLRKFMEGLADEYGPGKSSMNPKRFATALYYRSDTRVFLDDQIR
jgi:hypothetical protein